MHIRPNLSCQAGSFFEPVTTQTVTAVYKLGFILWYIEIDRKSTDWIGQPDLDNHGVIEMATTRTIKSRFPIKESADWTLWDLFELSDCVAISLIREFTTNNIFTDAHCTLHSALVDSVSKKYFSMIWCQIFAIICPKKQSLQSAWLISALLKLIADIVYVYYFSEGDMPQQRLRGQWHSMQQNTCFCFYIACVTSRGG